MAVYTGNITLKNYKSTGEWVRSKGNAQLILRPKQEVLIDSCEFGMKGYNCIEIGLAAGYAPKKVTVKNCHFTGELSNNAILLFRHQPNAVINIEDCVFDNVSNPLRFSNADNVTGCVVNIKNCKVKKWESNPQYAGFVLFQDYTSATAAAAVENNLFAPNKFTVNFINCEGPNGPITSLDNVIQSNSADQVAYVYYDKGGLIQYNAEQFPTFTCVYA